jgi:hypothetical protein
MVLVKSALDYMAKIVIIYLSAKKIVKNLNIFCYFGVYG